MAGDLKTWQRGAAVEYQHQQRPEDWRPANVIQHHATFRGLVTLRKPDGSYCVVHTVNTRELA
jgi:hypothetical protein